MGFINGFKSSGGLCGTNMFLSLVDWTEYGGNPIPAGYVYSSGYTGDMARQANMGGIEIEISGHTAETDIYTIDVESETNKIQIVLKGRVREQFDDFIYALYKRVYNADGVTYTDTKYQNSDAQIVLFSNQQGWAAYRTISVYAIFTTITYNGVQYLIAGASESIQIDNVGVRAAWQCFMYPWASFKEDAGDIPEYDNYSPEFGPASEPEGYDGGSFDYSSDAIDMPSKPQSVLSLGFVNVYKCEANALTDFGAALFPEIQWPQSLSDVGEVLAAFSDSIWNSKLIDYVVSVHCVPGDIAAGALEDIKVGARTMTGILARKITNEYFDFDFGTLHTAPIYRNFVDQMCEAQLYLPFYGYISLKPEHWNGGDISVKYRINVIDGSFTAYVFSKPAKSEMTQAGLIGQYGGSCVVHLPVSSLSYASMFSGIIGGATQAALGVATGSTTTAVSGAMTVAGAAGGGMTGGDSKMSNSYNASSSFMTRRRPYLLVSAPIPSFSTRYNIECGLPTNQSMVLGTLSGLVKASNPILDGIPCTDAERNKIKAALASGLIF